MAGGAGKIRARIGVVVGAAASGSVIEAGTAPNRKSMGMVT